MDVAEAVSSGLDHSRYCGITMRNLGRSSTGDRISKVAAAMSQISSNPSSLSQGESTWISDEGMNLGREHEVPDLEHTVMDR